MTTSLVEWHAAVATVGALEQLLWDDRAGIPARMDWSVADARFTLIGWTVRRRSRTVLQIGTIEAGATKTTPHPFGVAPDTASVVTDTGDGPRGVWAFISRCDASVVEITNVTTSPVRGVRALLEYPMQCPIAVVRRRRPGVRDTFSSWDPATPAVVRMADDPAADPFKRVITAGVWADCKATMLGRFYGSSAVFPTL